MSAVIIDGKKIAGEIRAELKEECLALIAQGVKPCLAVILVGDDPASAIYVRNKERACNSCGILSHIIRMPADIDQDTLMAEIDRINKDTSIHGLLIQMPIPDHLDEAKALAAVDAGKDVDGFHLMNAGALFLGHESVEACTPAGCIELLKRSGVPLSGANAVVIGRSNIVGKPMAMMLLRENCTVTVCHSRTRNIAAIAREADILVAALGKPGFVTRDMVKPGAAVIDVGINRRDDGKVVGDVDTQDVLDVAGWITPVPGGVGPMTIAMLLKNTLKVARCHAK